VGYGYRILTTDNVASVAITSDNTKIISGSDDNTIKAWDINGLKTYLSCKVGSSIPCISLSKSQNLVAFGDASGDLYFGFLFV
jgi:WD40 repeat protein